MNTRHLIFVIVLAGIFYWLGTLFIWLGSHTELMLIGIILFITGIAKDDKTAVSVNYLVVGFSAFVLALIASITHVTKLGWGANTVVLVMSFLGLVFTLMVYSDETDEQRLNLKNKHWKLFFLTVFITALYFSQNIYNFTKQIF